MPVVTLELAPVSKPRMTQSDRWKKRPCVLRYRAYCDAVREGVPAGFRFPDSGASVLFTLPMAKSWSQRRKRQMNGRPHQQKPDVDNLCKALFDALEANDAHIWSVCITKRWGHTGRVQIAYEANTMNEVCS
ncbi:MAG: RusA family crossover junction endodeoxyribonuclease [Rhodothermales bacterium]